MGDMDGGIFSVDELVPNEPIVGVLGTGFEMFALGGRG